MVMTDVMLDIETGGTDPGTAPIIQIGAVQFNYDTGAIGPVFNRCLAVPPHRYWDDSTKAWWSKQNKAVFNNIIDRMEPAEQVMRDLISFATLGAPSGGFRMWAKPTHFDFSFIASYCLQFGLPMPFHFRVARDMNSFIAALAGSADHVDMSHISPPDNAHDALADCVFQLRVLFAAKAKDFGPNHIELAEFTEITA